MFLYAVSKLKFIDSKDGMKVAMGWGRMGNGEFLYEGHKVSVKQNE